MKEHIALTVKIPAVHVTVKKAFLQKVYNYLLNVYEVLHRLMTDGFLTAFFRDFGLSETSELAPTVDWTVTDDSGSGTGGRVILAVILNGQKYFSYNALAASNYWNVTSGKHMIQMHHPYAFAISNTFLLVQKQAAYKIAE